MRLLQNLVQMTEQRDDLRLELSVLSTFLQLPHITGVRALELLQQGDSYWLRPRTWLQGQTLVSATQDFAHDPQRQPLHTLPLLAHCITQRAQRTEQTDANGQHTLWLPVWLNEQPHACLEIVCRQPPSSHALEVILSVFHVYQNYQSLLDYSVRDALTDLLNRKSFDEHLLRFATQGHSRDKQSWLAVMDIDHFKRVNDRFGHLFGDEVLILVANLLRSCFASPCRTFRFGGEEFVVLLPPMPQEAAFTALEQFRELVAQHPFPQVGQVTVSIGFAGATPQAAPIETLGQADQALYFAKAHGRNSVHQYEQLEASGMLQPRQVSHDNVEFF